MLWIGVLSVSIGIGFFFFQAYNDEPKIIFCDVGQGDGAYIRLKHNVDILIDAGPDRAILNCLGKFMPFYDRTIELAFLSHPQKDHYGGFVDISSHYKINTFVMSLRSSDSIEFQRFSSLINSKHIPIKELFAGDEVEIGTSRFEFISPAQELVQTAQSRHLDPNVASQIILFQSNNLQVLFTGDLNFKSQQTNLNRVGSKGIKLIILKVPHHGSKNGLSEKLLQELKPNIAVISVGKNNSYGHPHKEVLDLLSRYGIQIKRTDKEGNIEFKIE